MNVMRPHHTTRAVAIAMCSRTIRRCHTTSERREPTQDS
jgi:hypothetical protein